MLSSVRGLIRLFVRTVIACCYFEEYMEERYLLQS
jgi:hypothetical protein